MFIWVSVAHSLAETLQDPRVSHYLPPEDPKVQIWIFLWAEHVLYNCYPACVQGELSSSQGTVMLLSHSFYTKYIVCESGLPLSYMLGENSLICLGLV